MSPVSCMFCWYHILFKVLTLLNHLFFYCVLLSDDIIVVFYIWCWYYSTSLKVFPPMSVVCGPACHNHWYLLSPYMLLFLGDPSHSFTFVIFQVNPVLRWISQVTHFIFKCGCVSLKCLIGLLVCLNCLQ